MQRADYFNITEVKLTWLSTRIEVRGGMNILDLHLHSENFFAELLNLLLDLNLKNLNTIQQNAAGIDLLDDKKKVVAQVSSTATKHKIESGLAKKSLAAYKGYAYKFISISKDASDLRTKTYANPHGLVFSPASDIFDIPALLRLFPTLDLDLQKKIAEFLQKELKTDPDPLRVESNLATIIQILSKEDWSQKAGGMETAPYDIEAKISHNQLIQAKTLIDDYKIHYPRVAKIYSTFDGQGANKSLSILNAIRSVYLSIDSGVTPDECFTGIINAVIEKIRASANYKPLPDEELRLCVEILVVDTFIRCKIFKNPSGKSDVGS